MGPNAFSANDIAQFHNNYSTAQAAKPQAQQQQQKKGPGGIAGFLVNSLPAITSGVGAVGGSFLAPVAGTVAGGAAGGALGEALKRKILGQKEDIGQIATQGVEGGVLSGFGAGARGVKAGAQALTKLGTDTAEKEAAQATTKTGGSFLKNLTTQGQQAQGRVTGLNAGSKAAGKELTPQDTEAMLGTLKNEGIQTGNANNTLRDVTDKLKGYGQQISDHFKTNNAPLHSADTKVLADNYIKSLNTTDPGVLKQAQIIANDLQKNVTDTKSLWEFRKGLDSRIPDAKMAAGDNVLSNKLTAIKNARQYIAKELGNVPGTSNYHNLSEIKPFVSAEAKRLNNPSGGVLGRLASSGPVQKAESALGKGTEKIAQRMGGEAAGQVAGEATNATTQEFAKIAQEAPKNILDKVLVKRGIPVKYESDILEGKGIPESSNITLTDPKVADIEQELNRLKEGGFSVNQRVGSTPGSLDFLGNERQVTPNFTPVQSSPKLSSVELSGKKIAIPLQQQGNVERGIIHTANEYSHEIPNDVLQSASDATRTLPSAPVSTPAPSPNILQKLVGAAANPVANPGQTAKAVVKQEAGRGFGIPAAVSNQTQNQQNESQQAVNQADSLLQTSANSPSVSNNPYDPSNAEANVQAILQQGGTQADVAKYLSNVEAYQKLTTPASSTLNATQQQQANNATSALSDLQSIASMIQQNPDIVTKAGIPGSSNSVVQRLTGTTDYEAAKNNIVDVISRLRSGAAISASEEKLYKSLLPSAGDTTSSANAKLNRLANLFQGFANPSGTGGSNVTDLLANSGAQ